MNTIRYDELLRLATAAYSSDERRQAACRHIINHFRTSTERGDFAAGYGGKSELKRRLGHFPELLKVTKDLL